MHATRIKICGIRRPEDAALAARAGADAIGMVFVPGTPRNVSPESAADILVALPPFVTPVGLFVDTPPQQVIELASRLRLRHLQLHGHESPEQVAALRDYVIIKAIRVDPSTLQAELQRWKDAIKNLRLTHLRGLLLETANTRQSGGSGVENDWETIRKFQQSGAFDGLPPIIAAGGLKPENVASVVKTLQPWAVDVSSGVEASPGVKSPEKIAQFITAVRSAR